MSRFPFVTLMDASIEIIDGDRGAKYPKQDDLTATGDCLFLSAANVTRNGFNFARCQYISFEKDKSLGKGKLKRSDVILTTRGTVGNVAYFNDAVPFEHMRINSGMLILRADRQQIDPTFLYMVMRSDLTGDQIMALLTGSAQPQLPIRELRFFQIPLPPLAEQRAIAAILSTWDEAITLTGRLIDALKRRKQALMQLLLTGTVRFPGFDGEWEATTLGDVARISSGYAFPLIAQGEVGDDIPFFKVSDMTSDGNEKFLITANNYVSFERAISYRWKVFPKGSIVFPKVGAAVATNKKRILKLDSLVDNNVMVVSPETKTVDIAFLYGLFEQLDLQTLSNNGAVPSIRASDIAALEFIVPSYDEQTTVGEVLSAIDSQIDFIRLKGSMLDRQKRGLMQQLLTGQVRVQVDEGES